MNEATEKEVGRAVHAGGGPARRSEKLAVARATIRREEHMKARRVLMKLVENLKCVLTSVGWTMKTRRKKKAPSVKRGRRVRRQRAALRRTRGRGVTGVSSATVLRTRGEDIECVVLGSLYYIMCDTAKRPSARPDLDLVVLEVLLHALPDAVETECRDIVSSRDKEERVLGSCVRPL